MQLKAKITWKRTILVTQEEENLSDKEIIQHMLNDIQAGKLQHFDVSKQIFGMSSFAFESNPAQDVFEYLCQRKGAVVTRQDIRSRFSLTENTLNRILFFLTEFEMAEVLPTGEVRLTELAKQPLPEIDDVRD